MDDKPAETTIEHEGAGWITNHFGEEYVADASVCSVEFVRKGPAEARKLGNLGSFEVDEIGTSVEEFVRTYYGGGQYQLRLKNAAGKYIKSTTIRIAGQPLDPSASQDAISRELYGQGAPPPEEQGGEERPWALELAPEVLEQQPHLRRLLGEHAGKSEAAQIIEEIGVLTQSRRDDEKDDSGLVATMMKSNSEILALVLAAALKPDPVPAPAPADPSGSMKWMTKILEQQMQAQDRAHEQQMKGQQQMAENQAKMNATAMGGFMRLYSEIVRSSAGKEPEELMASLPDLLERFVRPFASTAPTTPFVGGGAPPAITTGPTHPAKIAAPQPAEEPGAPPSSDLVSDEVLQERIAEQHAQAVRQFIELLRYHMVYQAEPEVVWEQQMNASFGSLPPSLRAAIEAWDPEAEGTKIREILLSVPGVEAELVDTALKTAVTAPGAGEWLGVFWDCAPWLSDEEEPESSEEQEPEISEPEKEPST